MKETVKIGMTKKLHKFLAVSICAMTALFMLCGLSFTASSETIKGSLTLICKKDDMILSGMKWSLYKVGDRKGKEYVLGGEFVDYPVSLADTSAEGLSAAAATLENYAVLDKIKSDASGIIDEEGYLKFPKLEKGIYMVCGKNFYLDDTVYEPSAVLVEINPSVGEEGIDLMVYPKLIYKVLSETSRSHVLKKVWTDDGRLHPAIQVEIYKDDVLEDTITLEGANSWTYTWFSENYAEWRVKETVVPSGYTVTYRMSDGQYVIENTYGSGYSEETTEPETQQVTTPPTVTVTATGGSVQKLPQTGQLWWPVPVMACGGVVMIIVGLRLRNSKKSE